MGWPRSVVAPLGRSLGFEDDRVVNIEEGVDDRLEMMFVTTEYGGVREDPIPTYSSW